MSDGLERRDIQTGEAMAWHGKTNVVQAITRDNCGILYRTELRCLPNPLKPLEDGGFECSPYWAVFSLDDSLPIGKTVTERYVHVPNVAILDMIDKAIGNLGRIVSVGTVNDRSRVFATIQLNQSMRFLAGGRDNEDKLSILWGHGGEFSIIARSGFIVVVCQNTFNMALASGGKDFQFRIRHSGNTDKKLEGMEKAIEAHYLTLERYRAGLDYMATVECADDRAQKIIAGFIVRNLENLDDKVSKRTENTIDEIVSLFRSGKGNKGRDLCDVFMAITDFYSHDSSGGDDSWKQFVSSEFGAGNARKAEAFALLRDATVPKLGNLAGVISRGEKVLRLIA